MQPKLLADQFAPDELILLQREINDFINALQTREWAYCEGDSCYQDCEAAAEKVAQKLKKRLKGLAIECGIHAEFLDSFTQKCKQDELILTANIFSY
jgi:hypothetical protein